MAYIQKRTTKKAGDTWRVGWRQDGAQMWSPALATGDGAVEFKDLVERLGPDAAMAILDTRTGRDVQTGAPLLRDWFAKYLELLGASVTSGTVDGYRREAARTWLPRLGALPLDAITKEKVIEWVAWQRKQPTARQPKDGPVRTYSVKSIKNAHGLLSTTLAAAVEHQKGIVTNPAHGVKMPSDEAPQEMQIFTEAEWLGFIGGMDEHYLPLTRFLLGTGCRIGEATAVQAGDVNLHQGTVTFQRAWKKGETGRYLGSLKGRRERRTVVLSPSILDELRGLLAGKAGDDLVFTGRRGGRIQPQHFRNRQWQRALEAAGTTKRLTPHSLRHTSASWLLANGTSPLVVQHRLGHESLSTTSRVYAHLLTEEQAGASAILQRAIGA